MRPGQVAHAARLQHVHRVPIRQDGTRRRRCRCQRAIGEAGEIGLGQSFNGTTNNISIANSAANNVTDNFTISAWVKLNGTGQADLLEKGLVSFEDIYKRYRVQMAGFTARMVMSTS